MGEMSSRTPQQEAERRQKRRKERYQKAWPLLVRYADRELPMSALPQVAKYIGHTEDELNVWCRTLTDDCGFAEVHGGVLRLTREGRAHFAKTLPALRKGGRLPTPPGGFGAASSASAGAPAPAPAVMSAAMLEEIRSAVRAEIQAGFQELESKLPAFANDGQPAASAPLNTPRKAARKVRERASYSPKTNPSEAMLEKALEDLLRADFVGMKGTQ